MKYHFTPKKGWINDPNGLIKIEDEYHMFYQHYPDDIVWGPMHWGHAVSKDLKQWTELPIALYPDELGYIFSGSCILDVDNVSGFGTEDQNALIAFYTNHNPETGEQQQSIAYSLDYVHFTKYEGNPVIKNTKEMEGYQADFRDPKVFSNPIKGGYSMAVATGRWITFYHSMNLIDWQFTGSFDPSVDGFGGITECPDCFCIDGQWILTMSVILDEEMVGKPMCEKGYRDAHAMQYFIGTFDGDTFINTQIEEEPLLLDYGTDNYAMVSFANCEEVIMMGWGEHWDYVTKTKAHKARGKMTMARKVSLVETTKGMRLSFAPITDERCMCLSFVGKKDHVLIHGREDAEIKLSYDEEHIFVDRSESFIQIDEVTKKKERYQVFCAPRSTQFGVTYDVFYEDDYYEIFVENGVVVFSFMA